MLTLTEHTRKLIEAFADKVIAEIRQAIETKPVYKGRPANASGRTAASLAWEWQGDTLVISGAGHIFTLEFGRKPTSGGSTGKTLKQAIREWIDEKPGLAGSKTEAELNSMAYLITRSIHETGTLLYKSGQPSGTLSDAINEEKIVNLNKSMLDIFALEMKSILLAESKT